MLIQIGSEYPAKMPALQGPGAVIVMEEELFGLVLYTPSPSDIDINEWRRGKYRYSIFIEDNVPFFILGFEKIGLLVDASIDFLAVAEHGLQICDFMLGKSERITMTLVDSENNVVKAIRQLVAGPRTAKMLREVFVNQMAEYKTSDEVRKKIYSIFDRYSTEQMFLMGTQFQPAG